MDGICLHLWKGKPINKTEMSHLEAENVWDLNLEFENPDWNWDETTWVSASSSSLTLDHYLCAKIHFWIEMNREM